MVEDAPTRELRDRQLLRKYKLHQDRAAYDELVERFTPLAKSFARKYSGRGEELEDLVQVAMLGLVKAIEGFNLSRAHRFVSYAAPTISGEIKRHFRDRCWSVHVPRSVQELQTLVSAEQVRLTREGRAATPTALAERLGTSVEAINDALAAAKCFNSDSLSAPLSAGREKLDTVGQLDRGYGDIENADLLDDALTVLSDRDRTVVRLRYHDELLQREIGPQFGVSQMQVSRILEQSATKMREHLERPTAEAA